MNPAHKKNPEVKALLDKLLAEKDAIQTKTLPLRSERDRLLASIQPTLNKIKALEKQYLTIERPRLAELDNQIGVLVRVMGAKRMSDSPTTTATGV